MTDLYQTATSYSCVCLDFRVDNLPVSQTHVPVLEVPDETVYNTDRQIPQLFAWSPEFHR